MDVFRSVLYVNASHVKLFQDVFRALLQMSPLRCFSPHLCVLASHGPLCVSGEGSSALRLSAGRPVGVLHLGPFCTDHFPLTRHTGPPTIL